MATKTRNFNELRKRARKQHADWDANVAERKRAIDDALALAQLRQSRHVTQVQLAETLGISQGNVSRLEGRSDIYLSTLRSYIEALGGHLEIAAVFDDERLPVNIGLNEYRRTRQPPGAQRDPYSRDRIGAALYREALAPAFGFSDSRLECGARCRARVWLFVTRRVAWRCVPVASR
jgi:transcriptional regulator with XRE-family HTH domain